MKRIYKVYINAKNGNKIVFREAYKGNSFLKAICCIIKNKCRKLGI